MPRKKPQIAPNPTAFSLNGKQPQAAVKREISTRSQLNTLENTLIYGEDDALPLRIAKTVNESPATMACLKTVSKYIKGASFSNPDLMKLKIDKNGTTLWQFHTMLCDMIPLFNGFAVNFKFDGTGKITNSYVLSFESVRLCKPDDSGYISTVKYNPYFGTQEYKKDFTTEYHIYDIQQALNQIQAEGTDFKGQVYYYGRTSPVYRFYPVPDYWAAKNWIQIDGKIQEFHNQNLENGFFQSVLMNVIGDPSQPSKNPKYQRTVTGDDGVKRKETTKTVGQEFNEMMSEAFSGSSKAGTALALWSGTHDTAVKIQPFQTNSNADLFSALQDLTTKNITIATQVPGILANISEGVNLGSGGSEIQKAVELMQSRVAEEQELLEQFYNEVLLPNLSTPITTPVEIVNFTPVSVPVQIEDKFWEVMDTDERRMFIKKNLPSVELKVVAPVPGQQPTQPNQPVPQEGQITAPTEQVNEALRGVKISELNKIQKIVARFNLSKVDPNNSKALTLDQAKQFLASFGFNEEQINAWLVTEEELEND